MKRKFAPLYISAGLWLGMAGTALAQVPNPPTDLSVEGGSSVPTQPGRTLFFDNFEYDVNRSLTNGRSIFMSHGWSHAKSENSTESSGSGYLYTLNNSTRGSRVLVMESVPSMNPPPGDFPNQQTDYYLQYGNETGGGAVPANIWIQFWTYATPESRFATRDKTIYPCRGAYPCHPTWLFMWGSQGFEESRAPSGGRYLALEADGADRDTRTNDGNERKLFQNLSNTPLLAGRWYQVRLHMDISGTQGVYEAWIKERGQSSFTKVADWRGGQTANFSWPLSSANRQPFSVLRSPTTVNGPGDSTVYIDDFAIATSADNLPQ
ncbi:MAG: hypothetical protein SXG53_28970 [Pseudomonadota bacterium]|nr:hypothetical protein [Pseudomonadota bacterium]